MMPKASGSQKPAIKTGPAPTIKESPSIIIKRLEQSGSWESAKIVRELTQK